MDAQDEAYPHISHYAVLTIEGYCMLNIDYIRKKDPFNYILNPDGSFEQVENSEYDPMCLPDPYPDDCLRSVNTACISCPHFGWCEYEEQTDEESDFVSPE
ncbi:MAG TPA: hypothetical protein PLG55_08380 [Methanospirillum sp.]|uniref:hypothetical protein n=1 Tax=Methanospirillum sp. TaxID=45200 RepID=UPI002C4D928F|nr:hypothetical protein [Methanospirillum sp.]HPY60724.1 hypothetical protein [Methanospirillum sp.]